MHTDPYYQEIVQWLTDRGHAPNEIEKIMKQLSQYDAQMVRDSLFDSIEMGGFDMEAIIREALEKSGEE